MPCAVSASMRASSNDASSSSISPRMAARVRRSRRRRRMPRGMLENTKPSGLLRGEHGGQCVEMIDEALALGPEKRSAGGRESVVARASPVLRYPPLGGDELPLFHAVKCLQQGGVIDDDAFVGSLLEPGRDLERVHGRPGERLENEDVEGAFQEGHGVSG